MNWSKVKDALVTVAPWLSATLVSPIAGIAVKGLIDTFGLSQDTATPENVVAALAGASPDQLTALRALDQKHSEFMAQLGYSRLEQIDRSTVDDRNSARIREAAVKDKTPEILAGLSVILFLTAIGFVASGHSPADNMRDGFWLLVGAIIATYKDVYGYYFGSSKGSSAKDATIATLSRGDDK